jgi:hypothetical protein
VVAFESEACAVRHSKSNEARRIAAHVAELPDLLHSGTKAWRCFPTPWTSCGERRIIVTFAMPAGEACDGQ